VKRDFAVLIRMIKEIPPTGLEVLAAQTNVEVSQPATDGNSFFLSSEKRTRNFVIY
jgi:hypothetical protein